MNASLSTAQALRGALAGLLDGLPPTQAAQAVDRLIAHYRGHVPTDAPVLRDRSDVAAYAAYRMPATFEAVRAALDALREAAPEWVPGTHTDIGGGTGAASWAVAEAWDATARTTVLDWAEPALALGRELAAASGIDALARATWRRSRISAALRVESTDLVTVSYVLNELTEQDRTALVTEAARAARAVVIVEPGTPDGYARIIAARDLLIAAGMTIAAPCPHSGACPIEPGTDWCHFAARVSRSSLHRQVKGGSLAYEDEKFSYVVATRFPVVPAPARVTRKPQIRKGQVLLDLCTEADGLRRDTVTKRHGTLYKAARDAAWGDQWPPR
ncbi:methyltransferase domain-containing protein [Streptomyces sp. WAC05374]|uniref:small ribosomal subunit Rsm22 family protein n=1 Tax=Streptomyces sp. WAC05374 TaxID=2487420 RepID=UPI000F88EC33|nr:small ribosomal subunit Rsm22 family protein [Streptomyces sp. WAC05374]RST19309.1 methyltransferase domain-containing protein [Streptomyces sp. WAC05374]TDF47697.1 methyltransferase domain-containing protein [Streptomyces sp. WAC05374]TDF48705.1 methyltransferase domain-containing protein [Streptomyces sp. WAC05374]TDF59045.1 methyltransferase domain-containing protein [Streptomyces sp. WAC05374]